MQYMQRHGRATHPSDLNNFATVGVHSSTSARPSTARQSYPFGLLCGLAPSLGATHPSRAVRLYLIVRLSICRRTCHSSAVAAGRLTSTSLLAAQGYTSVQERSPPHFEKPTRLPMVLPQVFVQSHFHLPNTHLQPAPRASQHSILGPEAQPDACTNEGGPCTATCDAPCRPKIQSPRRPMHNTHVLSHERLVSETFLAPACHTMPARSASPPLK